MGTRPLACQAEIYANVNPGKASPPLPQRRQVLYFSTDGRSGGRIKTEETTMAWTTPTLVEICIGLEINGYLPAEF
ncbi:MAG: pyrroloquinoline quinone precursor peptide PqqA [Hyphomicrobiales bacterium]|nr:pyrroloquinoline quinone precursor peptide PqqA [Hyphomicrobiales bacterium]MBV9426311.1 pyrroloquinoline quinone precursor peptide PqqA [Bradyrhizobiaceae bacterium]